MPQTTPEPLIRFVIGGVQKGGTSALSRYLGAHPQLRLPRGKEAHLFDAPDFDDAWSTAEIDARYARAFDAADTSTLHGDATPFYVFHPRVVARIARYNPAMRWIVLLRDPIQRALSHYHMERIRGHERWPFWAALLLERSRLRGQEANFERSSPMRRHSYRARGDYAAQLAVLQSHFPRDQILLLQSASLERDPSGTVAQACRFLGLEPPTEPGDYARVFPGDYTRWPPGGWRDRLLRRWWRRELDAQACLGLAWDGA
jgi:Sulfotransferase domain